MKRFWGLPMGVSMLPRLAAMVCQVTVGTISLMRLASVKVRIARGTKMIRATSLVISMELK